MKIISETDIDNLPIEQVNEYLVTHGFDPDQVRLRGKILIQALKENIELRERAEKAEMEVKALRPTASEQYRFIWWVQNVYALKIEDLIDEITSACTYQDEASAAVGKYLLPKKCFDDMERISQYTQGIYDGTYLDDVIGTDEKEGEK